MVIAGREKWNKARGWQRRRGLCAVWTGHLFGWVRWLKGQRKVKCQVNVTGKWVWACSWDFYGLYAKREAKGETAHSVWQQSGGWRLHPTEIQSNGYNIRLNIILLWKLGWVNEINQIFKPTLSLMINVGLRLCFLIKGWMDWCVYIFIFSLLWFWVPLSGNTWYA